MEYNHLIKFFILFFFFGCQTQKPIEQPKAPQTNINWGACKEGFYKNQHKRRAPPDDFLEALFSFIKKTCKSNDVLYGVNSESRDVFAYLASDLGISSKSSRERRCAAMFELVRVSGAMESSYDWSEGRDKSANNYDLWNQEAGIFQTSPDSHVGLKGRWKYLDDLVAKHGVGLVSKTNEHNNEKWNFLMKDESKKSVIIEHHIFMLRHNYRHYGPMIDKERVAYNLSRSCIGTIEAML